MVRVSKAVRAMSGLHGKMADVCGVGLNATDTVIRLPHFPAFNSKVRVESAEISCGGQVASAMVACARWGLRTRYAGKIGDDAAGELQRSEFARAGVESHLIRVKSCASQGSFILLDKKSGERTILWQRDDRMELRPRELRREWVTNARALLVDGHDTAAAAQAARWAREARIPVTADLDNLYPGVEKLLQNVDYAITSKEFPARLTGEKNLPKALRQIQREYKNLVVGATLGSDGVIAWDGSEFNYRPAFRVKVMDTTGAGDIFHAAFAYAQLARRDLPAMLEFSCAAAALNCTAVGARGGIAPLAAIRNLMRTGPRHRNAFGRRRFA